MEVGVLFADLRGFTTWCADQPPEAVERALNRFYTVTTSEITKTDDLVDKVVGAGEVKDFTAVGHVVNTASRLQSAAHAGEIVVSEALYERIRVRIPTLPRLHST